MPSHRPGARTPQWPVGFYLRREGRPALPPAPVLTPTAVGAGLVMCASAGLLTVVLTGQQQRAAGPAPDEDGLATGPADPASYTRDSAAGPTQAPGTAAAPGRPRPCAPAGQRPVRPGRSSRVAWPARDHRPSRRRRGASPTVPPAPPPPVQSAPAVVDAGAAATARRGVGTGAGCRAVMVAASTGAAGRRRGRAEDGLRRVEGDRTAARGRRRLGRRGVGRQGSRGQELDGKHSDSDDSSCKARAARTPTAGRRLRRQGLREDSDGKDSDGKDSDGKGSEGKDSDGKDSDGQGLRRQGLRRQGLRRQGLRRQGLRRQGLRRQGLRRQGLRRQGLRRQGLRGKDSDGKDSGGKDSDGKDSDGKDSDGPRQGLRRQGLRRQGLRRQGLRRQALRRQATPTGDRLGRQALRTGEDATTRTPRGKDSDGHGTSGRRGQLRPGSSDRRQLRRDAPTAATGRAKHSAEPADD